MNSNNTTFAALALAVGACSFAQAEILDRPQGFKIGDRMTLRPYVSTGFTYDSNHGRDGGGSSDPRTSWTIDPKLDLEYRAETWSLDLNLYYGYRAYFNASDLNSHSYGETLRWSWSNAKQTAKGWTLMLSETLSQVAEDDDIRNSNGNGLFRNRFQFDIAGAAQRRFTDKLHGDINVSYHMMDYANNDDAYGNLYGWKRWTAGVELGYAASQWTDIIIAGSYQGYIQDNSTDLSGMSDLYGTTGKYSRNSQGYTFQGGLGSWATERISYRALAGWSLFEYGGEDTCNGFTYTLSGNWKIGETWNTMLMANSYYMPSESEYGSANRVDSLSWGLAKSLVRGKLNATLDIAYRKETREIVDISANDYDEDILSARLGLSYTLNRFFSINGNVEYERCMFNGDTGTNDDDDYNRFRAYLGFTISY